MAWPVGCVEYYPELRTADDDTAIVTTSLRMRTKSKPHSYPDRTDFVFVFLELTLKKSSPRSRCTFTF